ncbi:hypothetical protein P3X46_010327 [Hevea brasiliensis]|uniref:Reverse transcriptase domain-containing protein n=1 Tax=Hevea brasiliensis TaxID=3981 RepID=A0ABQ9MDY5_HEVBR|nr:hypothetical protein P3X46_010327 [Hevea brasiliensis]
MIKVLSIYGQSISWRGPIITHLLFADDSIIFSKVTPHETLLIDQIMKHYDKINCQVINLDKSLLAFNWNTPPNVQAHIAAILNIKNTLSCDKFVRLPSSFSRSKKDAFVLIKERIQNKTIEWKEKMLSQGGKEMLIKAVTQAIPVCAMSCFRLSSSLCKDINS